MIEEDIDFSPQWDIGIDDMAWQKPKFSRTKVDKAGYDLSQSLYSAIDPEVIEIVDNWRTAHNYPLNIFQMTLRIKALKFDRTAMVSQRIKRLSSIKKKLLLSETDMRLSAMQDIGGCRAVVSTKEQIDAIIFSYLTSSMRHARHHKRDYIAEPRQSGYRGIHLIYKYRSDRNVDFNGLKIEIQLRTVIQHAWATAVETVETFTNEALKANQGSQEWLRFFVLASCAFAQLENSPIVPNSVEGPQFVRAELEELFFSMRVKEKLQNYQAALQVLHEQPIANARYYLIILDTIKNTVSAWGYRKEELELATATYYREERQNEGARNVVLVTADSIAALKKAYPNYYMDTTQFVHMIERYLAKARDWFI